MHRARVAVKERMDVESIPLTKSQLSTIHGLLYPESFQVRVTPYPITNASKTMVMYSNNVKTTYILHRANGDELQSISFPLVEV